MGKSTKNLILYDEKMKKIKIRPYTGVIMIFGQLQAMNSGYKNKYTTSFKSRIAYQIVYIYIKKIPD